MTKIFRSFFFITIFLFFSCEAKESRYNLSICAIFQNESPYLKEWIDFHRKMGVQHFWLYNHMSNDDYQTVLNDYVNKGIVTLLDWSIPYSNLVEWNDVQCKAYSDCISKCKKKTKWLIVIDTDEFIFPTQRNNLIDFLKEYDDCVCIGVNWAMYGTSHISKAPENKLLNVLTLRARDDFHAHILVKCIVKPKYVSHYVNPHYPILYQGFNQVNSDKVPFYQHSTPYVCYNKIRVNHYWTRDEFFMINFKIPRRKNWPGDANSLLQYAELMNEVEDKSIFRLINKE